jgi:hypothetical protein
MKTKAASSTKPPDIFRGVESESSTVESESSTKVTRKRSNNNLLLTSVLLGLGTALEDSSTSNITSGRFSQATLGSSTADREIDEDLLREIGNLFDQGSGEFFQDGVSTRFSRALTNLLRKHGREAFRAMADYLASSPPAPDIVSEALRWLADINDASVLSQQWFILEQSLKDRSPRVRDGAILGFAALDNAGAKKLLLSARDAEQIEELRVLIDQAVAQLERPR